MKVHGSWWSKFEIEMLDMNICYGRGKYTLQAWIYLKFLTNQLVFNLRWSCIVLKLSLDSSFKFIDSLQQIWILSHTHLIYFNNTNTTNSLRNHATEPNIVNVVGGLQAPLHGDSGCFLAYLTWWVTHNTWCMYDVNETFYEFVFFCSRYSRLIVFIPISRQISRRAPINN